MPHDSIAEVERFTDLETLVSCPVCDQGLGPPAPDPRAAASRRALPFDVSRCDACRTYFRNPRPTLAAILASYDRGSMFATWREQREVRQLLWRRRLRLVQRRRTAGRLLDVGTGDGAFLGYAKAAGFQAVGLEPSPVGSALARAAGHDVRVGTLDEAELAAGSFDVITAWHVLEHVQAPVAFVRRIAALLSPEGLLFLAVPNEERVLLPRRLGWRGGPDLGPLVPGEEIHLVHFQPRTLRDALSRAGFGVIGFGVDDVDTRRSFRNWLKRAVNAAVASATGWHLSTAMYAVARRRASANGGLP
jgi:SAM-dependent methyltransferase